LQALVLSPQPPPPAVEGPPVVLHPLDVPPAADAEEKTAVRQLVEGRDFLGELDGVVFDDETDAAADLDGFRRRRRGHEGDEQIVRMPIIFRHVTAEGPGGAPAAAHAGAFPYPP